MKAFKKFFALLLALLMTMSLLATTAMADDANTPQNEDIFIKTSVTGHTYEAYQIFTGTVSGGVVSNIAWGDAISDKTGFVAALKSNDVIGRYFTADANIYVNDAKMIGTVLRDWSYNEDTVQAFADVVGKFVVDAKKIECTSATVDGAAGYKFNIPKAGYYFIKETTTADCKDGFTDYLVVLSGSTVEPKNSMPTFDMSVNYRVDGTFHNYVDIEIDAPVYIKLEASLPSLYEDYNQYHMGYKVTLPAGLNFVTNAGGAPAVAEAYVLHSNGATLSILNSGEYSAEFQTGSDNKTAFVDFGNLCDEATAQGGYDMLDDDKLVVKLVAQLSSNGVVFGNDTGNGNQITAEMLYSSNMNENEPVLSNGEHWTDSEKGVKFAKIPDSANVFSYSIQFQKRDSSNQKPLAGATFRLYRTLITEVDNGDGTKASVSTDYYAIFTKSGDVYRITNWVTEDNALTNENSILTSSAVTGTEDAYSGGTFTIEGLDSLSYFLKEIDPPVGYNNMTQPVGISVSATFANDVVSTLSANVDSNKVNGVASTGLIYVAPIYNTPGSSLPATGGMGTTIFYIVGGVLVLGAAAAFVMKRREA